VADEQGWTLGREVGWHVRFERRFSAETQVLFATEGILTARLQQDPFLSGVATIVLDEFHERSIHADLGLALARQAWRARDDLRLLVMSATLDATSVARYLDDCPILEVPGVPHPLTIRHVPDVPFAGAVEQALRDMPGNVLCFLPGAREIDDASRQVADVGRRHGARVLPLHGSLPADAQEAVLQEGTHRRIVLATNIAETSVTVPGVHCVVDAGWQKVARYDAARGIDRLVQERITQDAADQRAGRAARLGPGLALRLWDARDRLRPFREPDVTRVDLAPVLLAILAWGGDPSTFEWFERPDARRLHDALTLLQRLDALEGRALTPTGRRLARLPLSPRLGRLVLAADGHIDACLAAALLAEGRVPQPDGLTTVSDLLSLVASARRLPHLQRAAQTIHRVVRQEAEGAVDATPLPGDRWCRAVLAGFPDRVAARRVPRGDALLLASGTGARLSPASGVRDADYLVALEVRGLDDREPLVTLASAVEKRWLRPTSEHRRAWVDEAGRLRAALVQQYDALVLQERQERPLPDDHAALAAAWLARPRSESDAQLLARLAFSGCQVDFAALVRDAAALASTLDGIDLEAALPWAMRQRLLTHAPARLALPSGRTTALTYDDEGNVRAAVKLQELFGLADTPRLGPQHAPVLFELLAPNGRAVQTTRDLRSFWTTTYSEVRKELRGRYPKHPWPEDPWTATPTHRTTRRP